MSSWTDLYGAVNALIDAAGEASELMDEITDCNKMRKASNTLSKAAHAAHKRLIRFQYPPNTDASDAAFAELLSACQYVADCTGAALDKRQAETLRKRCLGAIARATRLSGSPDIT